MPPHGKEAFKDVISGDRRSSLRRKEDLGFLIWSNCGCGDPWNGVAQFGGIGEKQRWRSHWSCRCLPSRRIPTVSPRGGSGHDGDFREPTEGLSFQANSSELRSEAGTVTTVAAANRREGSDEICGGEERKEFGEDFWFSLKVAGAEKKRKKNAWTPVSVQRRRRNR
ncbi:hypothetical protein U1Q18_004429 [Sarracenia purpurea var. burkii]